LGRAEAVRESAHVAEMDPTSAERADVELAGEQPRGGQFRKGLLDGRGVPEGAPAGEVSGDRFLSNGYTRFVSRSCWLVGICKRAGEQAHGGSFRKGLLDGGGTHQQAE
jgi:hypothetical protein